MVIKPVGQSGAPPDLSSVGAVEASSASVAASQAASVSATADAANRAAIHAAVEQAALQVKAGQIEFSDGVSRVISAMADQQVPAALDGAVREARLREVQQVFGDDPRIAASVERLLRGALA